MVNNIMILFEFTSYINPPTKNEKDKIDVWSKRQNRKVKIINPNYKKIWEEIHSQMYQKKFGMNKAQFKLLKPSERAKLQKTLSEKEVIVTLWNGFHRMDLRNFTDELYDRLQGIAYKNDRQVVQDQGFMDRKSEKEYFKIIVEEME